MCSLFTISCGLDSIVTTLKDCIVTKASYVWDFKRNLVALQKASEDLTQAKADVNTKILIAEQQQMRRLNQVQLWLTRVLAVETQTGELLDMRSQQTEKLCLGGFCSKSPKSTYQFGKKVAKLLKDVADLKGEATTFVEVAERIPEDPVDEMPSEPTVGLESKFDEVWRCICDEQLKIIGLYGKGGVGKTTLLTQINNKFLQSGDEFVVIWALVSKDLQPEKIQEAIGKKIGLFNEGWMSKPSGEKARDIFRILSRRKFVLLLDDLWERVNLIDIGIPPLNQKIDFKVVFTTRSIGVCSGMSAHRKVEVECLRHAEAWILFQNKVGEETLSSHPNIPQLAKNVAKECGGLPLALITIGRAMAEARQPEEWEYAKSILEESAHEFPGMEGDVFCLLKFSYDRLPSDIYRSCLLYCSLFPEDYSIAKRDLIDCWIGEGFLKKYDGILARNFGYQIIGSLLRACLLEEGEEGQDIEYVKMHDVIRDMALWIACKVEKENVLVRSGVGLTRALEVGEWENVKRISLMKNQIKNLSETPNCPELLTLFLQRNWLKMLTSGFFQYIPHLQVLNLSGNGGLTELPVGISELVKLQHLDLSGTGLRELPEELKALTNLKCLNLESTGWLYKIPRHLISSLSMLRVLRMFQCGFMSNKSDHEGGLFIEELASLKHLNVLSIDFKTSHAFRRFLSSHELQNCQIESVSLHELTGGPRSLNVLSSGVLKYVHRLYIRSEDLKELVIDYRMPNVSLFHSLRKVELALCYKLREATWLIYAQNLKSLRISECYEMKEIISDGDELPAMTENLTPFARLQVLELFDVKKLETIYCNPLPFSHLKQIDIRECSNLKKLPLDSNTMISRELEIRGDQRWWNELQWEDQATHDRFLPFFKAKRFPLI